MIYFDFDDWEDNFACPDWELFRKAQSTSLLTPYERLPLTDDIIHDETGF